MLSAAGTEGKQRTEVTTVRQAHSAALPSD